MFLGGSIVWDVATLIYIYITIFKRITKFTFRLRWSHFTVWWLCVVSQTIAYNVATTSNSIRIRNGMEYESMAKSSTPSSCFLECLSTDNNTTWTRNLLNIRNYMACDTQTFFVAITSFYSANNKFRRQNLVTVSKME